MRVSDPAATMYAFDSTTDIGPQSGRTFFITGATRGIGAAIALELARQESAQIWICGRDGAAGQAVASMRGSSR
jgi:NAD(P)-dependent dehydrogenase (short-subunit alcohol dehydrogenase family)